MDIILSVFEWLIGLGSNVFLPLIIFVIGVLFGLKPGKAFISVNGGSKM